jgi:hypothetical protein
MEKYPNIAEVTLSVATSNGILNRLTTNEAILAAATTALEADGVYTGDVAKLEEWLGTLTKEQKETLADGEEEEMYDLIDNSPTGEAGYPVGELVEDIYDALEDV